MVRGPPNSLFAYHGGVYSADELDDLTSVRRVAYLLANTIVR